MNELDVGRKNCDPCSKELNQTESDLYTTLIHWLELITCIPWQKANSIASSPEKDNPENPYNEQYGVINIENIEDLLIEQDGIIEIGEFERCTRIKIQSEIDVKLNVYNYSTCNFIKSPLDVLSHIKQMYKILYEANDALCNAGLAIKSFGDINNIAKMENENFNNRASQNITFSVTRYNSIAETLIKEIKISLDCCPDDNNMENKKWQ